MILYQTENFGRRFDYRSNPHRNYVVPAHIHQYCEFAFTKTGITTLAVDGETYQLPPRHLILILPHQIHEYRATTASTMRCGVFSQDFVPAFFEALGKRRLVRPILDLSQEPQLLDALDRVTPTDTVRLCGLLNLLCDKLLTQCQTVAHRDDRPSLYYDAITYISEHFHQDIGIRDLARHTGYHEKYISSTLHALTGLNFRSFLASYRINYARHLLRTTDRRIADIAHLCGFSSINTFNRTFLRQLGTTPSQYRKK
jgi:AraC-like DNA-binding protein